MSTKNIHDIHESVLAAIQSKKITMRPKWQFVLHTMLFVFGVVVLSLFILYVASFIVFSMRQTGVWFAPAFGWSGVFFLLKALPVLLVIVLILFVVTLELLVSRFAFAYRRPLLYSVAGIVFVVTIGGYCVARTSFHGRMMQYTQQNIPVAGQLYQRYANERISGIQRGTIITLFPPESFLMENMRAEQLQIFTTMLDPFHVGDVVVVFGDRDDDVVHAIDIRKISD